MKQFVYLLGVVLCSTSVLANPCAGNVGNKFLPGEFCYQYDVCVGDVLQSTQLCPGGLMFDVTRQSCWYPDQVDCGTRPLHPCIGQPHWSFVPRPNGDCGAYYRCDNEVGVELQCPDGLYFDMAGQMCNYPNLVECGTGSGGTPPTAPTPTTVQTTTVSTATTGAVTTTAAITTTAVTTTTGAVITTAVTPTSSQTTTTTPTVSTSCVGQPDGRYLPDPARGCAAFILCRNGVGTQHFCPEPFHFDYLRQMCNYQDVVNCPL